MSVQVVVRDDRPAVDIADVVRQARENWVLPAGPGECTQQAQLDLAAWQGRNFGFSSAQQIALGVCEEAGEIAHTVLKASQKIRGMEDAGAFVEALADGIGDCAIYLMQLCTLHRLDFETVVTGVADLVMQRDWKQNSATGAKEAA